jgi:CarD family transcriptional regulator, regulator of rRNA transcription
MLYFHFTLIQVYFAHYNDSNVRINMSKQTTVEFSQGDHVVYPTHGVGEIIGFEEQNIAEMTIKLVVIQFEKDRMILRVPESKAKASGLRKLSSKQDMSVALDKLQRRTRAKRAMWSRRAQEYETKINSGNPVTIAEVVRELFRQEDEEQSYSERQMYQTALKRLAREFAVVEKIDEDTAAQRLEEIMNSAA